MILEISEDQIAQLNDTDLRALVAQLCEREVRAHQHSTSAVTWGGHQNAPDGGIDVRVALPQWAQISGYIPRPATGMQVKAQSMPPGQILSEMAPDGVLLESIETLASQGGAYIIVSSKDSVSDIYLQNRLTAMAEASAKSPAASSLVLNFYDSRRIASWVNQHTALVPWVRQKLGHPYSGWRPFGDWSSSPASTDAQYLLDNRVRLIGASIENSEGLSAEQALATLRQILSKPKSVVRLVGLSGVGKTRLIQALFDERIGEAALLPSDALYTDISDEPDPVPQEMLSQLISLGDRVVMIVDDCGIELHRKLAVKIASSQCSLRLITVEYDVNDDEPESTDVFKLEPASADLIEKILKSRYPAIAEPSRQVIAKFSEGNARVAFALAETAKNGESLGNLKHEKLFERLFYQQKGYSAELFDAAKACALLYSFDGDTLDGGDSELVPLAKLAGCTVEQLYKHVAQLHQRQLVQKRGKWRAILPHAVAHRLAKRALAEIPAKRIEDAIEKGSSRMLRSFSHRMGYLHDDERAAALAGKWFAQGGLLTPLGKLSGLGEEILENIAPVDPAATLAYFEEAAVNNADWFFKSQNENKTQIVRILRSIAYEPVLFARCAALLIRFVANETLGERTNAAEPLESLFWLYLSGTHATAAQRADFIKALLESAVAADEEIGATLLRAMLNTSHFTAYHVFEFGAWKRDYGFHPQSAEQIRDWYVRAIDTAAAAESLGITVAIRVRRVVATRLADLFTAGMLDEMIALADGFLNNGGWPEGWVGVRCALKKGKGTMSDECFNKLNDLEMRLRPTDLAAMIRSYALSPEHSTLDIADLEEDHDQHPVEAEERISELCVGLGQQLAQNFDQFQALLPEILAANSQKTFALGRGIASVCDSLSDCWSCLKNELLGVVAELRKVQTLAGFLMAAMVRAPQEAEIMLDEVLSEPRLQPDLVYFQINAGVNGKAFERFMKALALDTISVFSFLSLSSGRNHAGLDDEQLRTLLLGINSKEKGAEVASRILGMRIFGVRTDKLPISELIKATGRELLALLQLHRSSYSDHMIGEVIEASFDRPEHEDQVRAFCVKILSAVKIGRMYAWDLSDTIAALTKNFPLVVLDIFVDQAACSNGIGESIFRDLRSTSRPCPLGTISDQVWMDWAALKPDTRYVDLARVVKLSTADDEDHATGWSAPAQTLINIAPDPLSVLDVLLGRFRPNSYGGSLADNLASRAPMIEALKQHTRPEIAAWAQNNAPKYAAMIARQRAVEAAEDKERDETFE